MTSTSKAQVRKLTDASELEPLRARWNELAGDVPFCSFEWLESWWRAYGMDTNKQLCVLAVFDHEDRMLGLAPWCLEPSGAHRSVIRFLGSGEVCSDYLTILCDEYGRDEVTRALADWLCTSMSVGADGVAEIHSLELGGVTENDHVVSRLLAHLASRGKLIHRRTRSSCWRVNLPQDWESYLATLSKSHRKQIRRLERAYFDTGRAQLHVADSEESLRDGLEILMRLHQRRRQSLGDRGCFASPRFVAFHQETARRLLRGGQLRLSWLDVDGHTVAAEYQAVGGDVIYAYQSGIEPTALEHEPGRLITLATLRQAIAEGRQAFDFLRGDELYKAHWRAKSRLTQDIRVVSDTPSARFKHHLWLAGGTMKSWLKRNLNLVGPAAP